MTAPLEMPGSMYFFTLAIGCAGVAFVGIGLWSGVESLVGGDPFSGVNDGGGIGTALAFSLLYVERVTRWQKVSPAVRKAARQFMTATLIASAFCTVLCLCLAFAYGGYPHLSMIFGLLAALCQPATLYWLGRARPQAVSVKA